MLEGVVDEYSNSNQAVILRGGMGVRRLLHFLKKKKDEKKKTKKQKLNL